MKESAGKVVIGMKVRGGGRVEWNLGSDSEVLRYSKEIAERGSVVPMRRGFLDGGVKVKGVVVECGIWKEV